MNTKDAVELAYIEFQKDFEEGEETNQWLKNVIDGLKQAEKELKKPQELYDKIKEKRDNLRLIKDEHARKQDVSDEVKSELLGEICAYNYILSLMKNTFEVLQND